MARRAAFRVRRVLLDVRFLRIVFMTVALVGSLLIRISREPVRISKLRFSGINSWYDSDKPEVRLP